MPVPFPTQLSGAEFLATTPHGILGDQPRVGKTGAAIMAADYVLAEKILTITTASGRAVWKRAFRDWSPFNRQVQVIDGKKPLDPKVPSAIVGWGGVSSPAIRSQLIRRKWDAIMIDEAHFGKSFDAKRTQAVYGELKDGGKHLDNNHALASDAPFIWPLSGTLLPNSPADVYPHLRALWPRRLDAQNGFPDVTKYQDFLHRYCVVRMKRISNFRKIPVVVGGRNLEELKARMEGTILIRTQQDVGIRAPIYETFPLAVSEKMKRDVEANVDATEILAAAEAGDTKKLEMHLGPLRRLTGEIKARAVVEAVKEDFECGLDKIVLAYWHKDVGTILREGLSQYGVVGIDGSTSANTRGEAEQRFLADPKIRVFLGQIKAAGEAIDLSSAANLMFVETSFTPSDMTLMSLRVTTLARQRQAFVRVAVLAGSIDEALEEILLRKWSAIREVLKGD